MIFNLILEEYMSPVLFIIREYEVDKLSSLFLLLCQLMYGGHRIVHRLERAYPEPDSIVLAGLIMGVDGVWSTL